MPNLPEIEQADQISRERWAHVTGEIYVQAIPYDVRCGIVAADFTEFERVAAREPILRSHQFKQADLRRIFEIVKAKTLGVRPS